MFTIIHYKSIVTSSSWRQRYFPIPERWIIFNSQRAIVNAESRAIYRDIISIYRDIISIYGSEWKVCVAPPIVQQSKAWLFICLHVRRTPRGIIPRLPRPTRPENKETEQFRMAVFEEYLKCHGMKLETALSDDTNAQAKS